MSSEIMNPLDFQARMVERLREDVGKLIPDDKLEQMVNEAIKTMFFNRESRITDSYSNRKTELPSWWEKEVETQLKNQIRDFTNVYLKEHKAEIEKALSDALVASLPTMLAQVITGVLTGGISSLVFNMQSGFENHLRSSGMMR